MPAGRAEVDVNRARTDAHAASGARASGETAPEPEPGKRASRARAGVLSEQQQGERRDENRDPDPDTTVIPVRYLRSFHGEPIRTIFFVCNSCIESRVFYIGRAGR